MTDSDGDKIREKRLAKLNRETSTTSKETVSAAEANTSINNTQPTPTPNPFQQLGIKPQAHKADTDVPPRINVHSKPSADSIGIARPSTRDHVPQDEGDHEAWMDKQLRHLLRISLDPDRRVDAQGHALQYLPDLREELLAETGSVLLATQHLDQALTELGTLAASRNRDPFDTLLACWKRMAKAHRTARGMSTKTARIDTLTEARRLCMSYCVFAVTLPDMFSASTDAAHAPLLKYLIAEPDGDGILDYDFLQEASSRVDEDDDVKSMLVNVVEQISQALSTMSMADNYRPYMTAFGNLLQHPRLVEAICQSPKFLPPLNVALDIESHTILGPFFRLSPLQKSMAENDFSAPRTRDVAFINNTQTAIRMLSQNHQGDLYRFVNTMIRVGKQARDPILDWFAATVNMNHKRRAIRPDKTNSSDGFMINVTAILDRLCEPLLDAKFSKVDKVDVSYLRRNPRVAITDETKINADQKAADDFYSHAVEGISGFSSELFFLTVAAHHYGLEAATSALDNTQKEIKHMERELESYEAERAKLPQDPRVHSLFEMRLAKFREAVDSRWSIIHATRGILTDSTLQSNSIQVMHFLIVWLLRLASGKSIPQDTLTLPLSDAEPDAFRYLPEYFLEVIVSNFKYILRWTPGLVTPSQCSELIALCITFLRSSEYIKSPYLKSGLVSIMCYGVWPSQQHPRGVLGDILSGADFCQKYLLHALMKFYIEVESTGSHTQFYDKFNVRYEIDTIIKCIWPNTVYRESLAREASLNTDFFVRFVNLLLNDVTFVLDESFTSFRKIHGLTQELRDSGASMDQSVRQEKEELLSEHKRKAKDYMGLTNETMSMLKLFTEALATSFTMPEVVQRLADMLDYNLDLMVGPKRLDLIVENAAEYGFRPKGLLSDIVDVYLNLRHKEPFQLAVARDGRSYKPARFDEAIAILSRSSSKSNDDMAAFQKLATDIAAVHAADQQAEDDLGEIPDELQDPLMGSLMEDPVILPSSKQILDRSTIRSHLLSDATDPFNRMPLKIEDVIPAVDKKKEIDEFIRSRKVDKMDTS